MSHRIGIRPRQMDHSKPVQMVKDIKNVKKIADQSEREELINIEQEIHRVLGLYEQKKQITIPESKIIEKNKNDKNNIKSDNNKDTVRVYACGGDGTVHEVCLRHSQNIHTIIHHIVVDGHILTLQERLITFLIQRLDTLFGTIRRLLPHIGNSKLIQLLREVFAIVMQICHHIGSHRNITV